MNKCEYCGREFEPSRSNQRFCSYKCNQKYWYHNNPEYRARKKAKSQEHKAARLDRVRTCAICGKEFKPIRSPQKCCSPECRKEHYRRYFNDYFHKHHSAKEKLPLPVCRNCGNEFKPDNSGKIFCCRECYVEYCSAKKAAAKKPAAKNDGKTLGQWVREAKECGLDYGTYRAYLNMGKTYEELKAKHERELRETSSGATSSVDDAGG